MPFCLRLWHTPPPRQDRKKLHRTDYVCGGVFFASGSYEPVLTQTPARLQA